MYRSIRSTRRSFLAWNAKRPQASLRPYERRPRGLIFPWPFKKLGHGADTHPWPLQLSIYAARGTSADTTDQVNSTDGCATRRFIAYLCQPNRAAVVAELLAAK